MAQKACAAASSPVCNSPMVRTWRVICTPAWPWPAYAWGESVRRGRWRGSAGAGKVFDGCPCGGH